MYLGIDIGGTNTRIGLFPSLESPDCSVLAKFVTLEAYVQQLDAIASATQSGLLGEVAGVGVSVAARIAKDGRSIVFGPNLPDYIGKPFAQDLAQRLGCRVRLAHDTVCGLLAEKRFGVLREIERSAYLTVSTGTGAAIQLGKDDTSVTSSIEIGHQVLDGNTRRCLCGMTGCLETYTGGRQLALRFGRPVREMADPAFWETFTEKLAIGLVNLAQLTRIDAVAVSGAIALNTGFLLPLLQEKVNDTLRGAVLSLLPALLGENAPLVGAAALIQTPEERILH